MFPGQKSLWCAPLPECTVIYCMQSTEELHFFKVYMLSTKAGAQVNPYQFEEIAHLFLSVSPFIFCLFLFLI